MRLVDVRQEARKLAADIIRATVDNMTTENTEYPVEALHQIKRALKDEAEKLDRMASGVERV